MAKLLIIFMFIVFLRDLHTQNLVTNPSFEQYSAPPSYEEFTCNDWQNVCGSVDYYNKNARDVKNSARNNEFGPHLPHSGNGYIGLILFGNDGYQEFVQSELLKVLTKGQQYKINFHVKFSNRELCYSTWNIGAFLSDNKIVCINNLPDYCPKSNLTIKYYDFNYLKNVHLNRYKAQVSNRRDNYLNSNEWIRIEGIYTAKGDERFITLGGFYIEDKELNPILASFLKGGKKNDTYKLHEYLISKVLRQEVKAIDPLVFKGYAYYFIDNVSVIPVDENANEIILYPELLQPVAAEKTILNVDSIKIGESVKLENIFFEFDKSTLLSQSYPELQKLVQLMQKNKKMEVEIVGHTDNTGTIEYNLELSQSRAKAVVDYLITQGVDPQRLAYKGLGGTNPVADNSTEEGKAMNRRVEFIVVKK